MWPSRKVKKANFSVLDRLEGPLKSGPFSFDKPPKGLVVRLAIILVSGYVRCVGAWRSLVAHLVWDQGVASSNLAAPTIPLLIISIPNKVT